MSFSPCCPGIRKHGYFPSVRKRALGFNRTPADQGRPPPIPIFHLSRITIFTAVYILYVTKYCTSHPKPHPVTPRNEQAMHDEHTKKAMKHQGSPKDKHLAATPRRHSTHFPDSGVHNGNGNNNRSTPPAAAKQPRRKGAAKRAASPAGNRRPTSKSTNSKGGRS